MLSEKESSCICKKKGIEPGQPGWFVQADLS